MKKILLISFFIWVILVLTAYFFNYEFYLFPYYFVSLIPLILFIISSILIGWTAAELIFRKKLTLNLNNLIIYFALGTGLFAILTGIIGIAGFLNRFFFFFILLAVPVALFKKLINIFVWLKGLFNSLVTIKVDAVILILLTVFSVNFVITFIVSLLPVWFYDSLVYHITLPVQFIQNNKVGSIQGNTYSNTPLYFHMFYIIGLLTGTETTAKLMHFTFSIFSVLAVYSFAKNIFNKRIGIIAAVFFWSIPFINVLSSIAMVDMGLIFYQVLAFYLILKWRDNPIPQRLFLAAFFSGMAAGIKYNGLYFFVIVIVFLVFNRSKLRDKVKHILFYSLITLLIPSLWYVKNFYYTGNPLNPYLRSPSEVIEKVNTADIKPAVTYLNSLKKRMDIIRFMKLPLELTLKYKEKDFGSGYTGPLFLIFLPLLLFFFLFYKNNKFNLIFIFSLLYLIVWYLSFPDKLVMRFLCPVFPFLSALCAFILFDLMKKNRLTKILMSAVIILIFSVNIYHLIFSVNLLEPFKCFNGHKSRIDFLKEHIDYYSTAEFVNKVINKNDIIFFCQATRTGYFNCKKIYDTNYSNPTFIKLLKKSSSADELKKELMDMNVKYFLYNTVSSKNFAKSSIEEYMTVEDKKIFNEFITGKLTEIFNKNGIYLFKL